MKYYIALQATCMLRRLVVSLTFETGCKVQTIMFSWSAQGVPQMFYKKQVDGFRKTSRNSGIGKLSGI